MNIEQQIQQLIDQAPQYGVKAEDVQTIAPVLKAITNQLQHSQYYILQNLAQEWVMTTLQHRAQTNQTKNVIYAYASLEAVKANTAALDPQIVALPIPVVHILFQLLGMPPVDSIIFFDDAKTQQSGAEISRQSLQQLIQQYSRSVRNQPTDIA